MVIKGINCNFYSFLVIVIVLDFIFVLYFLEES